MFTTRWAVPTLQLRSQLLSDDDALMLGRGNVRRHLPVVIQDRQRQRRLVELVDQMTRSPMPRLHFAEVRLDFGAELEDLESLLDRRHLDRLVGRDARGGVARAR